MSSIPVCWRKGSGDYIYNTNGSDVPCGGPGPVGCCVHGSTCLSSGICHDNHAGKGQSGYYMQSCTDQSYDSSECPRQCTLFRVPDIVYNYTSSLWSCCGYDGKTGIYGCSDPTKHTFQAPAPEQLSIITSLAATGWTLAPTATSKTTSNTKTPTPTPTSTPSPDSSLSTGAKAGIGVGAAIGAIAAILFVVFLIRKRKKAPAVPAKQYGTELANAPKQEDGIHAVSSEQKHGNRIQEMSGEQKHENRVHEASGEQKYEMGPSKNLPHELE